MTDDLIEQLRCYPANRLCRQVADALEAKDARIAELEGELTTAYMVGFEKGVEHQKNAQGAAAARIAELEMSIDANDKWAEGFIEKTEAHIEELKAALKPFAAVCDVWEDGKTGDNAERYFTLRVGDLRAARAALEKK